MEDDRIIDRLPSGVSRVKLVRDGPLLWATGGGDGAVPDGTLVAYDVASGELVERRVFPNRSPYGIDAGGKGLFVALFHGDLLRITEHGTSSVPLSGGLTQVLVAHGKVWVSAPQTGKVWRAAFNGRDDTSAAATDLRSYPKRTCPQGLEASRKALWVADPCAKKVWLLDPQGGEVVDQITDLGKPIDISIHSGLAWIVSFRDNLVTVLSEETLNIVAQSHAGEGAIAITAHGREAWVANHEDYSLTHLTLQ
jgi:DNA-binding beta-propeller fold protein YncE